MAKLNRIQISSSYGYGIEGFESGVLEGSGVGDAGSVMIGVGVAMEVGMGTGVVGKTSRS